MEIRKRVATVQINSTCGIKFFTNFGQNSKKNLPLIIIWWGFLGWWDDFYG